MEDKEIILAHLQMALKHTRQYEDLRKLEYDKANEIVRAVFDYETRLINVAMDSGAAMIRDVLRALS